MGQNSLISSFFARMAKKASVKGQSPPQELEVGPHSGPYLLVLFNDAIRAAAGAFQSAAPSQRVKSISKVFKEYHTFVYLNLY